MNIVTKAKIAQAVAARIVKNLEQSTLAEQYPAAAIQFKDYQLEIEQDVMVVLDQKRWKL
jgi:hypothetical protein